MTDTTPTRRVLRFAVPVDDAWHAIGPGRILHVAARAEETDVVQVWTLEYEPPVNAPGRYVRIFGTGHALPPDAVHLGTALAAGGALVWHVFEQRGDTRSSEEWCAILAINVRDPDGWDRSSPEALAASWNEPITESEFRRRVAMSTVENLRDE